MMLELEALADWATQIENLSGGSSALARTVLVQSESLAATLRSTLSQRPEGERALLGTRFIGPFHAAMEVLRDAGIEFYSGEDERRPKRLLDFAAQLTGMRSPLRQLMGVPDWEHELARTITDLEGAGLAPGDLVRNPSYAHFSDIADLWAQVDTVAGRSWTGQRILREAALVLELSPEC